MMEALVPTYCSFSQMLVLYWWRIKDAGSSDQQTRIFSQLSLFKKKLKEADEITLLSVCPPTPESRYGGVRRDGRS
jgi:hypothetical protein